MATIIDTNNDNNEINGSNNIFLSKMDWFDLILILIYLIMATITNCNDNNEIN